MAEKVIGQGRTAVIKQHDMDKVIKQYKAFVDDMSIKKEFESAKLTHEMGIQTPKPYEMSLEGDNRYIIYEYIKGMNLADAITKHHKKAGHLAYRAGEIHGRLNNIQVEDLIEEKETYRQRISQMTQLDEDAKAQILTCVENLPDGNRVCHGDLHVENYLYDEAADALFIIDWMSAHKGNPEGDIARTRLVMSSPVITAELKFMQKLVVKRLVQQFNTEYMAGYVSENSVDEALIDQYQLPLAAIRLTENIPHEKEWLLGIIKKALKQLK